MKKIIFIAACGLSFLLTTAQNQDIVEKWSENTAFTMPKCHWETGIIQSFRIGLSDKVELRSNALILPVLPNVGVKFSYGQKGNIVFASEHSLSYPTLLLRTFQMKGTGGLISSQYEIPVMFSINNSILLSKPIDEKLLLSANLGLGIAVRSAAIDYRASIDEPFLYQRMAHYYKGIQIRGGISFKSQFSEHFFCEENFKIYSITRPDDNLFIENQGVLMFAGNKSFRLRGGYLLSWGKYPFGNHWQLWPVIDIVFGKIK